MHLPLPPPSPLLTNLPPNRSLSPHRALFLALPAPTLSPFPPLLSPPCNTSKAALSKNCRTLVFLSCAKRLALIERKLVFSQPADQKTEHASLTPLQIPTFGCLTLTSGLQLCIALVSLSHPKVANVNITQLLPALTHPTHQFAACALLPILITS